MVNAQMQEGSKTPEVQKRYALNTVEVCGVSVFKRDRASRQASGSTNALCVMDEGEISPVKLSGTERYS